jgi:hypothetical protein
MPPLSPYRSLPAAQRIALLTHALTTDKEARTLYITRLVTRGGGYRAATLRTWAPERLAREVVRLNAESAQDELALLQLLYVDVDPRFQVTFLDAAGVKHDGGSIDESLESPYVDAATVAAAAQAVVAAHGDAGLRYLRTVARYNLEAWPGLDAVVAALVPG